MKVDELTDKDRIFLKKKRLGSTLGRHWAQANANTRIYEQINVGGIAASQIYV